MPEPHCPVWYDGLKFLRLRAEIPKLAKKEGQTGGARAWKKGCGDSANTASTLTSSEMRLLLIGRGNIGAVTGTPANCVTEQMAQK